MENKFLSALSSWATMSKPKSKKSKIKQQPELPLDFIGASNLHSNMKWKERPIKLTGSQKMAFKRVFQLELL